MKLSAPKRVSTEILNLIAELEGFNSRWVATQALTPDRLASLRQVATIESVGSSTRIEGVKLTNSQIEALLRGVKTFTLRSRDEQEVGGYAEVMETIFASYPEIQISESHIKQLHGLLLKYCRTARVLNFEITEGEAPAGIVQDRDPAFDSARFRDLLSLNQVKNLRCPSRTPIANAFVERLSGTLQRECTDHFLFFNEGQLQRAHKEYQTYYNGSRPHQGINQRIPDLPENRASRLLGSAENRVFSKPYLEGLHHDYFWEAA
jgi:hypothetical protein